MVRAIDYTLLRRSVLHDLALGRVDRLDVCDAHPELLRAGRHVGSPSPAPCPVCEAPQLRFVTYAYGEGLRAANGRCVAGLRELERLGGAHDEFVCYEVEVCLECRWNHLRRSYVRGRLHGDGGPSRAGPVRSGRRPPGAVRSNG